MRIVHFPTGYILNNIVELLRLIAVEVRQNMVDTRSYKAPVLKGHHRNKIVGINDIENYDGSFGIKNSYRRLKLVHGDSSQVVYDSEYSGGTKVSIRFEYDFEKSENEPI